MKRSKIILTILIGILSVALMISCYLLGCSRAKTIAVDLSLEEPTFDEREPRYKFMPKEFSHYICDMCEGLGDDPDLDVSILMRENPKFDPNAMHINDNGTIDVYLWQMNDRYLWTTFKDRYWKFENVEFNPANWKHSTYVAIHHIHYLKEKLGAEDDIIMAYNCGEDAVMSGKIPLSTLNVYLPEVKNNLYLLRGEK
jgi:hypothetical protein